jgi:hypothetical protein
MQRSLKAPGSSMAELLLSAPEGEFQGEPSLNLAALETFQGCFV